MVPSFETDVRYFLTRGHFLTGGLMHPGFCTRFGAGDDGAQAPSGIASSAII